MYIPPSLLISIVIAMVGFLFAHLLSAVWIASKLNTRMEGLDSTIKGITKSLEGLEIDVKNLVKFDTKIEVLHERMNGSQADRREIWAAVRALESKLGVLSLK